MRFSIIIPFKEKGMNEKYLKNCIESLCNQTFNNFEVILLHNNSQKFLNMFNEFHLEVTDFKMRESDSLSDYRNLGINKAKGEYVIFLDSDDYLHPNALVYANEMINDNQGYNDVFKFGITKTNLDKLSTLNRSKRAFFEGDSFSKLETILNEVNIDANEEKVKKIINGMFEKQLINHKYHTIKLKNYFKDLNYQFRVHSFIIKTEFLKDNYLYFKSEN
ncbi:glycosyltransferase family A protein, partial [Staphylococcus xylosus]